LNFQREGLTILMVLLSLLMVSTVKYPRFPAIGLRTFKGILGLLLHLAILVCSLAFPSYFLFPLGITYLAFGLARHAVLGFVERHDGSLEVVDSEEHDEGLEEMRQTTPRVTAFRRGGEE
jgi:phosphatidylserine synthase